MYKINELLDSKDDKDNRSVEMSQTQLTLKSSTSAQIKMR
jgi:hypothetical protein